MTLRISRSLRKISCLVAIFLFVHSPVTSGRSSAFQSFTPVVTSLVGIWMAYRLLSFRRYRHSATIWRALRGGWPMFLLRSGVATYSTANVLVLGMFAPASVVGYYASAEKLSKAIVDC